VMLGTVFRVRFLQTPKSHKELLTAMSRKPTSLLRPVDVMVVSHSLVDCNVFGVHYSR
jgi:hypothetical protein